MFRPPIDYLAKALGASVQAPDCTRMLSLSLWLDMLMGQERTPGFTAFVPDFLGAFVVHLEGDPFT